MTIDRILAAVELCRRPQGAQTEELQRVLERASYDCPTVLRYHLPRIMPNVELISRKSERHKRSEHGNARTYFIQEKKQ